MPVVITIIVIVLAFAISQIGNILNPEVKVETSLNQKEETLLTQDSVSQVQQFVQESDLQINPVEETKPSVPTGPTVLIDTFIKYGPLEKEIIEDTNRVVFEFGARVSPEETEGQISFETKIEGFDEDWQRTHSKERTIDLPLGVGEYTFWVRAEINDAADPTPAKRNFKINISPYFEKVKISRVEAPTFDNPSLITLSARLGSEEEINITGWEAKGEKGSFIIPRGVEKYDSLNPISGEDIFVKSGDLIYISSDLNPIWGKDSNFRPNKCMGYLESSYNFIIPITKNCPRPRQDRLPRYLGANCQAFINSRETCESLNHQRLEDWNLLKDYNCMDYITSNFNYAGCFTNYSQDQDFLEKKWHIYMNRPEREIMNINHDTIYLLDQDGLLIDKYSYGKLPCPDHCE